MSNHGDASDELWWVYEKTYEGEQETKPKVKKRVLLREAKGKLEDVLSHYGLDIDRATSWGDWVSVRCPFHEDRHASASVNLVKGLFVCHACDMRGDSIELVMEQEGLTFGKALEWIAKL